MMKSYWPVVVISILLAIIYLFHKTGRSELVETITFGEKLSEYGIFTGKMAEMIPAGNWQIYELSAPLFTDYADKQRLFLLPEGKRIIAHDDGLPVFPEGTIIAKTFYYNNHVTGDQSEKKVIETRLLIKNDEVWNGATYQWTAEQDEAWLTEDGDAVPVEFYDDGGNKRSTLYQIPTRQQCANCHAQNNRLSPLGPKIRNLNVAILKNGAYVDQPDFFRTHELLKTHVEITAVTPDYTDETLGIDARARAYLDVNCAHCHNPDGEAYYMGMDLSFDTALEESGIVKKSAKMATRMTISGSLHMPQLGTSMDHAEGIELVSRYIESLE